jgi:uncharacterized membrane protein YphA (DoxX/SURF4 family)
MSDRHLTSPYWALRLAFGVVPIVAGVDKFFNLLTNWEQYLSPLAARLAPFGAGAFMRAAGVVEILVGIAILTRLTRLGAYVGCAWLALIAFNLLLGGHYLDVAARDAVMAVGAFTLARLEEARQEARAHAPATTTAGAASAPSHA